MLHYEHRHEELLPMEQFVLRQLRHTGIATLIVVGSLGIGMLGYHIFEGLSWLDSFVNASMLLGGMGPVNELKTSAGKLFAGCYALFAGMVFLVAVGVLFTPLYHRFLHRFHLEVSDGDGKS
jgi:hypothetical protein